jgi:hypothetical protein
VPAPDAGFAAIARVPAAPSSILLKNKRLEGAFSGHREP